MQPRWNGGMLESWSALARLMYKSLLLVKLIANSFLDGHFVNSVWARE